MVISKGRSGEEPIRKVRERRGQRRRGGPQGDHGRAAKGREW